MNDNPTETPFSFLAAFFAHAVDTPDRFVELRAIAPERVKPFFFPCTPAGFAELLARAGALRDLADIYIGIHARLRKSGKAGDVAEYGCAVVDMDCGPGKPHADIEAAEDRLAWCVQSGEVPRPSWIIGSGGGLHVYWCFDAPLPRTSAGDDEYQAIMAGLREPLDGDPAVSDAPRIMRLPGSLNHKLEEPREVPILDCSGVRYAPAELPHAWEVDDDDGTVAEPVELPKDLSPRAVVLVAGLKTAGVPVKVRRDRDGGISALVLNTWCPSCMTDKAGRTRAGAGKGKVHIAPVSLALRCKHGSCALHGDGWPVEKWLPAFYPSLAGLVPVLPASLRDPRAGMSLEAGQVAVNAAFAESMAAVLTDINALRIVDCTVGVGKTEAALRLLVERANSGEPVVLLCPTHTLLSEVADRAVDLHAGLPEPDRAFQVVHVQGRGQVCRRFDKAWWQRSTLYGETRSGWRCCKFCEQKNECDGDRALDQVGKRYTLTVAPRSMADAIMAKMPPECVAIFDELPPPLDPAPVFTVADLEAVTRPDHYLPSSLRSVGTDDDLREYFHVRAPAFRAVKAWLAAWAAKVPAKSYTRHGTPAELLAVMPEGMPELLRYERAGLRPALTPGEEPVPGLHVRADLDDLAAALLDLAEGNATLDAGVPYPVLSADGVPGLVLLRPFKLPAGRGVIILAGGAAMQEPLIRAAWPGRDIFIDQVDVAESEHVRRLLIESKAFDMRRMSDTPERLAKAFQRTMRALLPDLLALFARKRERLAVAVVAPKRLAEYLGETGKPHPAFLPALALLAACRMDLHIAHHGAVEGLDAFKGVDCLAILGDALPNVSESAAWASCLKMAGGPGGPDAAAINAMRNEYAANQVEGRIRGVRRTAESPVLLVRVGRDLAARDKTLTAKGAGKTPVRMAAELVTTALFEAHGGATFEAVKTALVELASPDDKRIYGQKWDYRVCARALVLEPLMSINADSLLRTVHRAVSEVAKSAGAVSINLQAGARGAPAILYALPGREVEAERWARGLELAEPEPVPEPVPEVAPVPEVLTLPEVAPEPEVVELQLQTACAGAGAPFFAPGWQSTRLQLLCSGRAGAGASVRELAAMRWGSALPVHAQKVLDTLHADIGESSAVATVTAMLHNAERIERLAGTREMLQKVEALCARYDNVIPWPVPVPAMPKAPCDAANCPEPEPEPLATVAPVGIDTGALVRAMCDNWPDACEYVQERAAVREYDGGQTRVEAEQGALCDLAAYLARACGVAGVSWPDLARFEDAGLWAMP